jgi:succinate-semialdehyde dehydrogenase/glutarate-semialdehyde dehydrogenase
MNQIIENAFLSFTSWKKLTPKERAPLLRAVGNLLESSKHELAVIMAQEMGKPITEGKAEIEKCARTCSYFADAAPRFLEDDLRESALRKSFVRYEPLGPILAIMPWNYPFWQVFRMAAPALMAGNTLLIKHSLTTPQSAAHIANLFVKAGACEGLVQVIEATHEQIPHIIGDDRIRAVTLTGSTRAGKIVGELAGRYLKKIVLELGGSDPFIILEDVSLDEVVPKAVLARCQNSGQSCIAAKRFIVHSAIIDDFLDKFSLAMNSLIMGDPLKESTQIGPMANKAQQELLDAQVSDARAKGATILTGGELPTTKEAFYPPTVITNINSSMRIHEEELFGPVACVYAFNNHQEAIKLANDTPFGLSSSIWTSDEQSALSLVNNLECGSVFINAIPRSDPGLPFGGVKTSGIGRELGREGLLEFTNQKTICMG